MNPPRYGWFLLVLWAAIFTAAFWAAATTTIAVHEDGKQDGLAACTRARAELGYYEALADSLCSWYVVEGEPVCMPRYTRTQ